MSFYKEVILRGEFFFIREEDAFLRILSDDIEYFYNENNRTKVVVRGGLHELDRPIENMVSLLSEEVFLQVHPSYIVRIDILETINFSKNELTIKVEEGIIPIPIGIAFKQKIKNTLIFLN